MIKKKVGVIGCGKWGRLIINELKKISTIKFIYNSKNNLKQFDNNIDWIFILTPNKTHYQIVSFFLKKKINVFCEKPLTLTANKAIKLVNLAKSNGVKLYIDDIENFKKKNIKLNEGINSIIRTKKDFGTSISLLERLAYHDLYLLRKKLIYKKIVSITGKKKIKSINFKIILQNNTTFNFYYDINSKIRKHLINKINFEKFKNNPISDMLKFVLYKKANFKKNNLDAIFCIMVIKKIIKNIN
jgi:hypothetical protein|tara:strand:- start:9 stop:737 length:729 start_codon:yes stop_codon:yes gene_type:complete